MKRNDFIRVLILRTIGNFLVLFTIFGFFATFGPALYYEAIYRINTHNNVTFKIADAAHTSPPTTESAQITSAPTPTIPPPENLLSKVISGEKEQILVPKSTDFSIIIPKIGASEKVFANTDPTNEKEYLDTLFKGVAHAKGSAFPGMDGNIYLFAHSADNFWDVGRYNAVFYLIKELEPGDEIAIFFNGQRYNYIVDKKEIVNPDDVSHISANLGGGEQLILQTCWPPGTTWKRLLVFAKPK